VERKISEKKYEEIRPCFLNASKETVEKTFNSTTQHAKTILSGPNIWNKQRSANPALNIP